MNLIKEQRVNIAIEPVPAQQILRDALGDLVAHWPDTSDDSDAELEQVAEEIDQTFQGQPPLSKIIIEDRGQT